MDVDALALAAVAVAAAGLAIYVIAYQRWARRERRPGKHVATR